MTVTSRPPSWPLPLWLFASIIGLLTLPLSLAQNTSSATSSTSTSTSASSSSSSSSSAAPAPSSFTLTGVPTRIDLPAINYTNPTIQVGLPALSSVYLTLSICSLGSNASIIPRAILSTAQDITFALGSRPTRDPESSSVEEAVNVQSRSSDTWSLTWNRGYASWSTTDRAQASILIGLGIQSDGTVDLTNVPQDNGNILVHMGVSSTAPLYSVSPTRLLLGDTIANSVLLFSPLLEAQAHEQPSYPKYTLPGAQLPLGEYPGPSAQTNLTTLTSNYSLVVVPTSSSPTNDGLDFSLCAVRNAMASTGNIAATNSMLVNATTQLSSVGGLEGYRTLWVLGDLLAETNYTAWLVDDQGGLAEPIFFATKESTFPCQLILPNDICPVLGYSTPLEANTTEITLPGSAQSVLAPLFSLPDSTVDLLTSSLNAFSTSLLSSACGRDLFSHVSTCADCYAAYRDWLCRLVVPQCAPASSSRDTLKSVPREAGADIVEGVSAPYEYNEMLPCLSTCNRVDRVCPVFLQFRCPRRSTNAEESYGFLGDEADEGDGDEAHGYPALDKYGNRWCNG